MHPIAARAVPCDAGLLSDFALVVREHEVHTAAVDVEGFAEVFGAHGGALGVPAREADAPRGVPAHDVLGRGFFPECEVHGFAFFGLAVEVAGGGEHFVDDATGEVAVGVEVVVVFSEVEVDAAVADVGEASVEDFLNELDLFDDVAAGEGFDAWA